MQFDSGAVPLKELLSNSKRNFLVVTHRARTSDDFKLNDLTGGAGRWDGVVRAVTASLHLSHGMRRDTSIHILLQGPPDPPKLLSVQGDSVRYLNPDERAAAALLRKAMAYDIGSDRDRLSHPSGASPGIWISRTDIQEIIASVPTPILLLDEKGEDILGGSIMATLKDSAGSGTFVLSDDRDLSDPEKRAILGSEAVPVSLGPETLHTDQAIVIVHNILDRFSDLTIE